MAKIINLMAARKAQDRAKARQQTDENAVKFGRTKAQKQREAADAQRADQTLNGALREKDDPEAPCPPGP